MTLFILYAKNRHVITFLTFFIKGINIPLVHPGFKIVSHTQKLF